MSALLLRALLLCTLVASAACAAPGGDGDPAGDDPHRHAGEQPEAAHAPGQVHLSPAQLEEADVALAPVEHRSLLPELTTTGEVGYDEDRMAHVSPRIRGRVHGVRATLGDRVRAGQILVLLDSVELGRARAAYAAARTEEQVARENFEREKRLQAEKIGSEKEMLEARAALARATARRQSAEETLRLYGLSEEDVRSVSAEGTGGSLLPVRAPLSGRVVDKHATIGELVTPAENLFTLADLGQVWVWIDVFERDLAAVHLGDGVEITVPPYPGRTFTGEVSYLGPEVSAETRTVRARIDVANPDGALRPGMFARVRLTDPHAEHHVSALVVPASAIQRHGGEQVVFVPAAEATAEAGAVFERRAVEVGRSQEGWVEILDGLEEGDRVVTEGAFLLKSELSRDQLGGGHHH